MVDTRGILRLCGFDAHPLIHTPQANAFGVLVMRGSVSLPTRYPLQRCTPVFLCSSSPVRKFGTPTRMIYLYAQWELFSLQYFRQAMNHRSGCPELTHLAVFRPRKLIRLSNFQTHPQPSIDRCPLPGIFHNRYLQYYRRNGCNLQALDRVFHSPPDMRNE